MHRFFVEDFQIDQDEFIISDQKTIKYARKVLRLSTGDRIELFNSHGESWLAEIGQMTKEGMSGVIVEQLETVVASKPVLILGQSLPKGSKMDDIVRMNTELGVSKIIPFESKYSQIKHDQVKTNKIDRWQRIAIEATRQSENPLLPEILPPRTFAELLDFSADLKILLHSRTREDSVDFANLRTEVTAEKTVLLLVGPEGGFAPEELDHAVESGFIIAHLNLPILRTETAGVVAASYLLL